MLITVVDGRAVRLVLNTAHGPILDLDMIALALAGEYSDPLLSFELAPFEYPDGSRFEGGIFDLSVRRRA